MKDLPKDCVRLLYLTVVISLLVSCALALSGCVYIVLYPEYMTNSCIGERCSCTGGPHPDTTGPLEPKRGVGRIVK